VESLSRPGGNVTGTSAISADVVGKSLQPLVETVPRASKVAVLWNPANPMFQTQMLREAEAAARALRLDLQPVEARTVGDLEVALQTARQGGAGALIVLADPVFTVNRVRLAELAAEARLPAIYGIREAPEAGDLMSDGPDYFDLSRRAATYVDRILKGAKPADLPIEQPTKFELVVNLKAARALGLAIPPSVLGRADKIIE
jgi:putative ABC transport system substrate-binding protein